MDTCWIRKVYSGSVTLPLTFCNEYTNVIRYTPQSRKKIKVVSHVHENKLVYQGLCDVSSLLLSDLTDKTRRFCSHLVNRVRVRFRTRQKTKRTTQIRSLNVDLLLQVVHVNKTVGGQESFILTKMSFERVTKQVASDFTEQNIISKLGKKESSTK